MTRLSACPALELWRLLRGATALFSLGHGRNSRPVTGAGFKPVEGRAACLVGSTPTSFRQYTFPTKPHLESAWSRARAIRV